MKLYKYTINQLKEAVKDSTSIRQTLQKLKVEAYGGNYDVFRRAVKHFNIDTSHFTGQSWNKDKKFQPKRPIEEYLNNNHRINSHKLRKRLIKEKILLHKCNKCKLKKWLKKDIPLELHHEDGNRKNNNLKNLKLLCPNCHAQTSNYRGKAKKRSNTYKSPNKLKKLHKPNKICKNCKNKFIAKKKDTKYCSPRCYQLHSCGKNQTTKIKWPNKKELLKLVWSKPTSQLAKKLGVSDKAITKRCKKYNINKPPRGYWTKKKIPGD